MASQPTRCPAPRQNHGQRVRSTSAAPRSPVAPIEKYNGTYSDELRKLFVEWARKMSPARPPKFATANSSTSHGRSPSASLTSMLPAQLGGLGPELHCPRQHRVVAVPLHEV